MAEESPTRGASAEVHINLEGTVSTADIDKALRDAEAGRKAGVPEVRISKGNGSNCWGGKSSSR